MTAQDLRQTISQRFSLSNIRTLCFDLGIEYEELGGGPKSDVITALIEYCQRNERLTDLQNYFQRERSFVNWAELFANLPAPSSDQRPAQGATTIHVTGDVYGLTTGNRGTVEQNFNFGTQTKPDNDKPSEA
jgi:hypothetical protein